MNIKSVRFRLAVWYFLAFFISAVIIFSIFYYATKQILIQQTDRQIASHGVKIVEVLSNKSFNTNMSFPATKLAQQFEEMPGMLVLVTDKDGKLITSSQIIRSGTIFLADTLKKSAGITYFERNVGASRMRIGVFKIMHENNITGFVFVGHPIDVISNSLNNLLKVLLATLFTFGFMALIGGYAISRAALSPIRELSNHLKKISDTNLNQQIINLQTGDELEELSTTFNSLLYRLNTSIKREQQFIADVAHELKTPLATLKSFFEVGLSKQRDNYEYKKMIEESLLETNHLSSTLKNILDLAWSETPNEQKNKKRFNVTTLVDELFEIAQKMAIHKKIEVKLSSTRELYVYGFKEKLARAILNIIENAVKYSPRNGKIELILEKTPRKVLISVIDNGSGILKEDLPNIFDRFYRGSKTDSILGSGLGLAIAKAIVTLHQGQIKIKSIIGKGSTFIIVLPCSQ